MKVVYVAGPFKGATQWEIANNVRRAEALALEVWRLGAACVCPHANTANFFQALGPGDHVFYEGDLELVRRCDAVMLTADWKRSGGAKVEVQEALAAGKPVFERLGDLALWLSTKKVACSCQAVFMRDDTAVLGTDGQLLPDEPMCPKHGPRYLLMR